MTQHHSPWLTSARWWVEPANEAHPVLGNVYRLLAEESKWKIDADEYHAALYCGSAGAAGITQRSRRGYTYGPATLPYNLCRSATDTLVAKIAKHRPLPQVLTQRGDWKAQKRGRKMTQFLEGAFYKYKVFEKYGRLVVRDAAIFRRGGWLKVSQDGRRICVERCHPWEILVDDWDGRYDDPRNLYHCRSVDKGVALEAFCRTPAGAWRRAAKDAVEAGGVFDTLATAAYRNDGSRSGTVDRVDVLEAWHLCDDMDAHEADDEDHTCTGRHVVIVPGGTLVDEAWPHPFFPFARLRYSDPLAGADGISLVEQLEGYQYETNLMAQRVSEGHETLGGAMILVPDGAAIHEQHITNGIRILQHKAGGTPQLFQPTPVHPHAYQRLHDLTADALADVGISQMSAMSQKPAGIESGIALQTLDDIETERFIVFGRAYEAWCLDVARLLIECIKSIAEEYGEFSVPVPMKQGVLQLNWADVVVDGYKLRVFPTSLLPQQLPARIDRLKMLFETQIIDRAAFLRYLDAPDLSAELDIETADKLLVDEQIDAMLDAEEDEGEAAFKMPSPYLDLEWAARRAHQRLNRAELDGAPEFNKELLRRYVEICQDMIAKAAPPPEPAPPSDMAGPMGPVPPNGGGEPMPGPEEAPLPAPLAA